MTENENGQQPAFPIVLNEEMHRTGLTKREYFAAMAMQGILSESSDRGHDYIVKTSVQLADALLNQLNKK